MPLNSNICPRNSPKRRQKTPKTAQCAPTPRNQARALGIAGGQPGPRTAGASGGSTRVPGAKKIFLFKVVPRPLGMLQHMSLARFESVGARFGPRKIQKCLENGPFQDEKWVENGSKTCFSESDLGPFGMLKQMFLAHLELALTRFGPWKSENALKMGRFKTKNGSKMSQKSIFAKVILDHWGCTNNCFQPILSLF